MPWRHEHTIYLECDGKGCHAAWPITAKTKAEALRVARGEGWTLCNDKRCFCSVKCHANENRKD